MMGVMLVRCSDCEQLSLDPRTGKCDTEPNSVKGDRLGVGATTSTKGGERGK